MSQHASSALDVLNVAALTRDKEKRRERRDKRERTEDRPPALGMGGLFKQTASRIKSAASRSSRSLQSDAISITKSLGMSDKTREKVLDYFKLLIVATPPIGTVIFLSILMITQVDSTIRSSNNMNSFLNHTKVLNNLVSALQMERGMGCVLIARSDIGMSGDERDKVEAEFATYKRNTDTALKTIAPLWNQLIAPEDLSDLLAVAIFNTSLVNHRNSILKTVLSCPDNIDYYTPRINTLIYNAGRVFYESEEGLFWGSFDALRMVMVAGEMMGLKRATGGVFFSKGYLSQEMFRSFVEISGAEDRYIELAGMADADVRELVENERNALNLSRYHIQLMTDEIFANYTLGDAQTNSIIWFDNMTIIQDRLVTSTRTLLNEKLAGFLAYQVGNARNTLYIAIASVTAALCICVPITIYYSIQSTRMQKKIKEKIRELGIEKTKSENILFQMMPKEIVRELQAGRHVMPRTYAECTVYFSDIKGFTDICAKSSPLQVVDLLNSLYTAMDNVLDQYGVYKVETIGDAYLVVSGIPKVNNQDHSNQICTMALHMLQEISTMTLPHRPDHQLRMRIGCNTGPCAAGIVGVKMPRYCLFGDTVNTASRMESTGLPMRIQLSETTCNHLRDHHCDKGFVTPFRGESTVKGKGVMRTYWLQSRADFPYVVDLSEPDPKFAFSELEVPLFQAYTKKIKDESSF